ncbi:MAG: DUF1080 domain-containing protein [Planctomycetaceae bacterium]|nr:DUF1080 domain-containing protein [Planctomycetaceae bacterium]
MIRICLSLACLLMLAAPVSAEEGEWINLFNGRTLEGWTQKNGIATYSVEDGAIVGRTAPNSPNSFLCSTKDYGDFELEFEVQVHPELNSGCQIRSTTAEPTEQQRKNNESGRVNGPQVEIESGPAEAGYVYGEATGRGWLTPMDRLKPHDHMVNDGWNKFRIIAQGPRIQTFINGEPIEDLTDEEIYQTHPKGFIGLQVHGVGKREDVLDVRWRNLRIRELSGEE